MRKDNSTYQFLVFIFLGVVFPFIMLSAIQKGTEKTDNYIQNGRLTECTIVSVQRVARASDIRVEYIDTSGKTVTARAILNRSSYSVGVGDKISAYVLPSAPDEVLVPAGNELKLFSYAVIALFTLAGWIIPIYHLVQKIKMRRSDYY